MKVVILAGGFGTRLSEETQARPKPMVEIGGRPILWHIMKHYAHYGFNEFVIALGYKGEVIKRFFLDYYVLDRSVTVNLGTGDVQIHHKHAEDWVIHLVDTGLNTMTGGRLLRLRDWLQDDRFMVTYGDGVSDVDLPDLLKFHESSGCLATITAVRPPSRFGGLVVDGNHVVDFIEKPQIGEGWINGGFAVLEPGIFKYLKNDQSILEKDLYEQLAQDSQLSAYRHTAFWQCMDTMRELNLLEALWQSGGAPWKIWS